MFFCYVRYYCGLLLYLLLGRNPTRTVPITSHERPMRAKVILQEDKRKELIKVFFVTHVKGSFSLLEVCSVLRLLFIL